jgi:endonuclease-3
MVSNERIVKTLKILTKAYPEGGVLEIGNPFAMTVAVLLSARTKDEQVLKCLAALFEKYPTPGKMAKASPEDIAKRISSVGFYRTKAKHLKALAEKLVNEYAGVVPDTMDGLITLPGVGRKTASVILVAAFGKQAIAVDTHVFRVVTRLGWVKARTPQQVEKKLLSIVPYEEQREINHTMVPFGRAICVPNPRCWACPLVELCEYKKKNLVPPANAREILKNAQEKEKNLHRLKDAVKQSLL